MTPDTELREAMAKALHRASYESGRHLYPDNMWEIVDEFERERWRVIADAGIRAFKNWMPPLVTIPSGLDLSAMVDHIGSGSV